MESKQRIAVIGLGYVRLPLAVEFAKRFPVTGFDINSSRVEELRRGFDRSLEIEDIDLKKVLSTNPASIGLYCSDEITDIRSSNYYIITVPTPTNKDNHLDLGPLLKASETIAKVLKKEDVVIYESTVYP